MADEMKDQEWTFGHYAYDSSDTKELMVWYPEGETGEKAVFTIFKGWRNLTSGATYSVRACVSDEGITLNGTLPTYVGYEASDAFRMMCEAGTAEHKRTKARKQAEAKVRKMDLGQMTLLEVKELINSTSGRNRRMRAPMITMVSDYLNGIIS